MPDGTADRSLPGDLSRVPNAYRFTLLITGQSGRSYPLGPHDQDTAIELATRLRRLGGVAQVDTFEDGELICSHEGAAAERRAA